MAVLFSSAYAQGTLNFESIQIDWGTTPIRPVDFESKLPNGFKDYTPKSSFNDQERDSLKESKSWQSDGKIIFSYADLSLWEKGAAIYYSGNVKKNLEFDHLRIYSPEMSGAAIEVRGYPEDVHSFTGNVLEVNVKGNKYGLRAYRNSGFRLDVNKVWLESHNVENDDCYVIHAQAGGMTVNSDEFVALYKGQIKDWSNSSDPMSTGVAAVMADGSFEVNGGNYYFAMAEGTANAENGSGIYADDATYVHLGKDNQNLNLLSVTGVGWGLVSKDTQDYKIFSDNLFVETLSDEVDEVGTAVYVDNGSMEICATDAILNGDVTVGTPSYDDPASLDLTFGEAGIKGQIRVGFNGKLTVSRASESESGLSIVPEKFKNFATSSHDDLVLSGHVDEEYFLYYDSTYKGTSEINFNISTNLYSHDLSNGKYVSTRSDSPLNVISALRANADSKINLTDAVEYSIFGNVTAGLGFNPEIADEAVLEQVSGGTINIGGTGSTTALYGDVFALNGGTVNIDLQSGSVMEGQVDAYLDLANGALTDRNAQFLDCEGKVIEALSGGTANLSLADGSKWFARGKNFVSDLSFEAGSSIDLTKEVGSSLLADKISGETEISMKLSQNAGQSSMLYFGEATEGTKIKLNVTGAANETIEELDGVRFATVKTSVAGVPTATMKDQGFFDVTFDVYTEDYSASDAENDRWNGSGTGTGLKPGADVVNDFVGSEDALNWVIGKPGKTDVSDAGQTILGTARAAYWNAVVLDRWNQRYGERVYDGRGNGVYARVKYEHLGTDAGTGDFSSDNTMHQFGYDKVFESAGGKTIVGAAVDYMDGRTDFKSVEGDGGTDRAELSLYATYAAANGAYADMVFRAGRLSSDFDMLTPSGQKLSADYKNWLYGISLEGGHLLENSQGWFLEPQLQAQFVRITSGDYSTAQTRVDQDAVNSFITRAGFRVGRYLSEDKSALVYAKADVLREWHGEQKFNVRDVTTVSNGTAASIDNDGTWFDIGAGGQIALPGNWYAFGDVEYRFGNDLARTVVLNVGAKYTF